MAAGNVYPEDRRPDFVDVCDLTPAQDPSQAWNVVTVGGCTDIADLPADPMYAGYRPLAPRGEISPHSRTSVLWANWPIKPDIVLEAGNLVVNGAGDILDAPAVNLLTTSRTGDLTEANRHQRGDRTGGPARGARPGPLPRAVAGDRPWPAHPRRRMDSRDGGPDRRPEHRQA